MKELVVTGSGTVEKTQRGATLRVEAWSSNCIRVRFTLENDLKAYDWAIREKDTASEARVSVNGRNAIVTNGAISVEIVEPEPSPVEPDPETSLRFFSTRTGKTLLQEKRSRITLPDAGHSLRAAGPSSYLGRGAIRGIRRRVILRPGSEPEWAARSEGMLPRADADELAHGRARPVLFARIRVFLEQSRLRARRACAERDGLAGRAHRPARLLRVRR